METLEMLYREHYQWSCNYARRFKKNAEERKDFVGEMWLKVARYFDTYERNTNFRGWIATIMWSMAINDWRRDKRYALEFIEFDEAWCTRVQPDEYYCDYGDEMHKALDRLEPKMRQAVICKYVKDMRQIDVAAHVGIPKGTVGSRTFRALRHMKKYLKAA